MTLQNTIAIAGGLALLAIVVRGFVGSFSVTPREGRNDPAAQPYEPPSASPPAAPTELAARAPTLPLPSARLTRARNAIS